MWFGEAGGDSRMMIGEMCAPSSPPGAASAAEVFEGGPPPIDGCGVEALGGSSRKLSSPPSSTGRATAKGCAWTAGAGGVGGGVWTTGGGVGVGGDVGVGTVGGKEGAALFFLKTSPSSVSSLSSSPWTVWGCFLLAFFKTSFFQRGAGGTSEGVASRGGDLPWMMAS